MDRKIQNWAFVAPKMSRDLSEYFEGILDFKAKFGLTMNEYRASLR